MALRDHLGRPRTLPQHACAELPRRRGRRMEKPSVVADAGSRGDRPHRLAAPCRGWARPAEDALFDWLGPERADEAADRASRRARRDELVRDGALAGAPPRLCSSRLRRSAVCSGPLETGTSLSTCHATSFVATHGALMPDCSAIVARGGRRCHGTCRCRPRLRAVAARVAVARQFGALGVVCGMRQRTPWTRRRVGPQCVRHRPTWTTSASLSAADPWQACLSRRSVCRRACRLERVHVDLIARKISRGVFQCHSTSAALCACLDG